MRLLFLGPQGAGKGTQAKRLSDSRSLSHLSTGDIFRAAIKEGTPAGTEAKSFIDKGELVPDEVTNRVVKEGLSRTQGGWILDGYPRNSEQGKALDLMLEELEQKIDAAVLFTITDEVAVQRLSGRRNCPDCGEIYHVEWNTPTEDGICNECGAALIIRKDDEPEAIRTRLAVYHSETEPLRALYQDRGILIEVPADGGIDEVTQQLEEALEGATTE